jgi:hypothetical protein
MSKIYALFCIVILFGYETASYAGYSLGSLFSASHHVGRNDPRYHK